MFGGGPRRRKALQWCVWVEGENDGLEEPEEVKGKGKGRLWKCVVAKDADPTQTQPSKRPS